MTWQAWIAVVLALLITFPVTRPALVENPIRQFNPEYFENLVVFDAVSQLCRIDPGPILAHPNQGQYLLFHTGCPVYSTNHAAWEAQYRGRQRTLDMLALTPAELRQQYPDVKYVLLNRYDGTRPVERPEAKTLNQRGLHGALLQGPVDPASGFAMVSEVKAQRDNDIYPLTRLFLVSDISEEESQ